MLSLLLALITLSGCGLFAAADEEAGPLSIRTAQPTFTPTPPATEVPTDSPAAQPRLSIELDATTRHGA